MFHPQILGEVNEKLKVFHHNFISPTAIREGVKNCEKAKGLELKVGARSRVWQTSKSISYHFNILTCFGSLISKTASKKLDQFDESVCVCHCSPCKVYSKCDRSSLSTCTGCKQGDWVRLKLGKKHFYARTLVPVLLKFVQNFLHVGWKPSTWELSMWGLPFKVNKNLCKDSRPNFIQSFIELSACWVEGFLCVSSHFLCILCMRPLFFPVSGHFEILV